MTGLASEAEARVEVGPLAQATASPLNGDAPIDVNQAIRDFKRKNADLLLQRFTQSPDRTTAQGVLDSTIAMILDAAGRYEAFPPVGVVSDSRTDAKLPADTECVIQLIGNWQARKYIVSKAEFPLRWELKQGHSELSAEQIQAVKDQIELARQLMQ